MGLVSMLAPVIKRDSPAANTYGGSTVELRYRRPREHEGIVRELRLFDSDSVLREVVFSFDEKTSRADGFVRRVLSYREDSSLESDLYIFDDAYAYDYGVSRIESRYDATGLNLVERRYVDSDRKRLQEGTLSVTVRYSGGMQSESETVFDPDSPAYDGIARTIQRFDGRGERHVSSEYVFDEETVAQSGIARQIGRFSEDGSRFERIERLYSPEKAVELGRIRDTLDLGENDTATIEYDPFIPEGPEGPDETAPFVHVVERWEDGRLAARELYADPSKVETLGASLFVERFDDSGGVVETETVLPSGEARRLGYDRVVKRYDPDSDSEEPVEVFRFKGSRRVLLEEKA